jgi:hypothetical protein
MPGALNIGRLWCERAHGHRSRDNWRDEEM